MDRLDWWLGELRRSGAAVIGPLAGEDLLADVRKEAQDLVHSFDQGDRSERYWHFADGDTDVLYRIHGLEAGPSNSAVIRVQSDEALLRAAAIALGVAAPVPTVAALIVKQTGHGARVPWHQDRLPTEEPRAVNLTLYLHDSDTTNGCVQFIAGSHLLPEVQVDELVSEARAQDAVRDLAVAAGDVTVHDVRLVHGSGPNPSSRPRLGLVLEYAAACP
jgi:phytanoyl-CoA hydroxylase